MQNVYNLGISEISCQQKSSMVNRMDMLSHADVLCLKMLTVQVSELKRSEPSFIIIPE